MNKKRNRQINAINHKLKIEFKLFTYLSQYSTIYIFCRANAVFVSALYLIHQTNMIMLTVKDKCE